MLRYKINVSDALTRAGVNMYKAPKTKVIGQDTLKYVETSEDTEERNKIKS